jgi:hypothetical protein
MEMTGHYSNLHDLLVELRNYLRYQASEDLPGTARLLRRERYISRQPRTMREA